MTILDLGLRDYEEVWRLQKELVARRRAGEIPDTVILVEHPRSSPSAARLRLARLRLDCSPSPAKPAKMNGPGEAWWSWSVAGV